MVFASDKGPTLQDPIGWGFRVSKATSDEAFDVVPVIVPTKQLEAPLWLGNQSSAAHLMHADGLDVALQICTKYLH